MDSSKTLFARNWTVYTIADSLLICCCLFLLISKTNTLKVNHYMTSTKGIISHLGGRNKDSARGNYIANQPVINFDEGYPCHPVPAPAHPLKVASPTAV